MEIDSLSAKFHWGELAPAVSLLGLFIQRHREFIHAGTKCYGANGDRSRGQRRRAIS
jgi:hypothetical protein